MEPKMEGVNKNVIEKREMNPVEVLKHMENVGNEITRLAIQARAMIEEANDRNIPIDLSNNEDLNKFNFEHEYDSMLLTLKNKLSWISAELHTQGVLMTAADLDARLEKMEK